MPRAAVRTSRHRPAVLLRRLRQETRGPRQPVCVARRDGKRHNERQKKFKALFNSCSFHIS